LSMRTQDDARFAKHGFLHPRILAQPAAAQPAYLAEEQG
jgi:hypothetical protein